MVLVSVGAVDKGRQGWDDDSCGSLGAGVRPPQTFSLSLSLSFLLYLSTSTPRLACSSRGCQWSNGGSSASNRVVKPRRESERYPGGRGRRRGWKSNGGNGTAVVVVIVEAVVEKGSGFCKRTLFDAVRQFLEDGGTGGRSRREKGGRDKGDLEAESGILSLYSYSRGLGGGKEDNRRRFRVGLGGRKGGREGGD